MPKDAPAERELASIKRMLKFLDMVPHHYKVGPWSPVAHTVILAYLCFLLLTMVSATESHVAQQYISSSNWWLQPYRIVCSIIGVGTSALIIREAGIWPMFSYTLTSWNLMTIRLISSFLAAAGWSSAAFVADTVRFPALVGCSITVSIWWAILVPLIDYLLSQDKDPSGRTFFWKWNTSAVLINVHLLNLPIAGIEFLASGTPLTFYDLWVALAVAFAYCLFYLNVLDPRGLHFYIIFTPRTAWCFISYILVLTAYYSFYHAWNQVLALELL
jgi:hypothetical protein